MLVFPTDAEKKFNLKIKDPNAEANNVVFSTDNHMIALDPDHYYIRSGETIHSDNTARIFGLGERVGPFYYEDGIYSMWARDQPNPLETGKLPGNNVYGTQPFYMTRCADEAFIGVFRHSVAGMDFVVKNDDEDNKISIDTIATSGQLDLFVIIDTHPEHVVEHYHSLVGKPVLTPKWLLGWHQCRWGYKNTARLREVR